VSGGGQVTTRGPVYSGGSRVVVARPYYNRYYRPYYISRPYFYDPFFWGSYGWGWGWGAGLGYGYGGVNALMQRVETLIYQAIID